MEQQGPTGVRPADVPIRSQKASLLYRVLAKSIDLLLFAAGSMVYPVGTMAGFLYLLIADGLWNGRSVGKRVIGLRVWREDEPVPGGIKESVARNLPVAAVSLFALIPILGWVLFVTLGALILLVELALALKNSEGQRAGDLIARTVVREEPKTGLSGALHDLNGEVGQEQGPAPKE